jgi:TolB-like protein
VDAIRCAIKIQQKLQVDPKVPLRIGIHLGDILIGETDIVGDSVNLASRVESLGSPGSILITNSVRESVKNQDDINTRLLGSFHFKNDEKPREIHAIVADGILIPRDDQIGGKLEKTKKDEAVRSLAVLPFDNFTGDESQEYLVAGIHDNLITTLSQVGSIRVISKTSTLRYKNSKKPIPEIAKELNVDAIIEASVTQLSDDVHLNVQCISAFPEEDHIWAQVFDSPKSNLLALYNQVTLKVAKGINLALSPREEEALSTSSRINEAAYDAYLRGCFHWEKLSAREFEIAKENFEKSISIDPSFALLMLLWLIRY